MDMPKSDLSCTLLPKVYATLGKGDTVWKQSFCKPIGR